MSLGVCTKSLLQSILRAGLAGNLVHFSSLSRRSSGSKGLVLGVYEGGKVDDAFQFTKAGEVFDSSISGKLKELLTIWGPSSEPCGTPLVTACHSEKVRAQMNRTPRKNAKGRRQQSRVALGSGPALKKGRSRTFYGLHQDFPHIVVVGLGGKNAGVNHLEQYDEGKENIRAAIAVGCRQLQDLEVPLVEVDPCGDAQCAAEGSVLGLFEYNELKKKKKTVVTVKPYG
uniref:cytosol aminopeptidase-like n=2 Tax=Pristiophorus japonicus TaxID=55135 RepID=UPI00398E324E